MARDHLLHKVRTALGRSAGQNPEPPPPVYLHVPEVALEDRVRMFRDQLELLAGQTTFVPSPRDAAAEVARILAGREAVVSNSPFLAACGITALPGVHLASREACATMPVGITSCDYALADTGTLVMLSEARLVSLLPPMHIAVVPAGRILTGLDELLTILPNPAATTSSMVLITGPSRTADIEQILVRGVHGPGEIYAVVTGSGD